MVTGRRSNEELSKDIQDLVDILVSENAALRVEVERLTKELEQLTPDSGESARVDALEAALARYREAVEWAYKELSANEFNDEWWSSNEDSYSAWVAKELRRRAGEGE